METCLFEGLKYSFVYTHRRNLSYVAEVIIVSSCNLANKLRDLKHYIIV